MKDLVEALVYLFHAQLGLSIPEHWAAYGVLFGAFLTIAPGLMWFYLSIRRWRGDFRAISSELSAATEIIQRETKDQLTNVVAELTQLQSEMKDSVHQRFDALHGMLKSIEPVESRPADSDIEVEASPQTPSKRVRLDLAENVRNAVLQKWVDGRFLSKTDEDPNCYEWNGCDNEGQKVRILLQTPYRAEIASDGRLPFTLELWVDGYKKLNFEWDSEGKYALRGFRRGDWFQDVVDWNLRTMQRDRVAA